MTVSITDRKITYAGNGITTAFSIPFPFQNINSDIVVVHIDSEGVETVLTLDVNYFIFGSNLTYPASGSPLPTGESLLIYRNTPLTQTANVDGQPTNFLLPIENALDRLQFQMQQLQEEVDRCVKTDITDPASPPSVTDYNSALSIAQALQTAFENLVVYTHSEVSGADQTVFTMPGAWPDLDGTSNVVVYDDGLKIDRAEYSVTDTDEITFSVGRTSGHTIIFELHQAVSSDALDSVFAHHQHYNAIYNSQSLRASNPDYTLVKDVYGEGAVVGFEGMVTGTTVTAGTLTRKTTSSLSRNGFSIHFSGVTTTGTGHLYLRHRLYSDDAKRFINRFASFSCNVLNDLVGARFYKIIIRTADALDDFSSTTEIGNSGNLTVYGGANAQIKYENINLGACGNGIEIEIYLACGIVTANNFEFSELQFEDRTIISDLSQIQKPLVLQTVHKGDSAYSSGTTQIPWDNTKPENTEGTEFMTLDITPMNANSKIFIEVVAFHSASVADRVHIGALFKDSEVTARASAVGHTSGVDSVIQLKIGYVLTPGSTAKITFKYKAGMNNTGTMGFNGVTAGQRLLDTMASYMRATEIKQ